MADGDHRRGTTIATDDVQTGILKWKASDPVTGSTATFSYDSSGFSRFFTLRDLCANSVSAVKRFVYLSYKRKQFSTVEAQSTLRKRSGNKFSEYSVLVTRHA